MAACNKDYQTYLSRRTIWALGILILFQIVGCAHTESDQITAAKLRETLAGKSIVNINNRTGFKRYFDPNGTHIFDPDKGFYLTGNWFVGRNTKKLCDWEVNSEKPRCAAIKLDGDRIELDYGGEIFNSTLIQGNATDPNNNPGLNFDPSLELSSYQLQDVTILPPEEGLPGELADLSGGWYGTWYASRDFAIIVEKIDSRNANLVYAWGPNKNSNSERAGSVRTVGRIDGSTIKFNLWGDSGVLSLRSDGNLKIDWESEDWSGRSIATHWHNPPWESFTSGKPETPDPTGPRTRLQLSTLLDSGGLDDDPVHNSYFKALGSKVGSAHHAFQGRVKLDTSIVLGRPAGNRGHRDYPEFPKVTLEFFTYGDELVPRERHTLITRGNTWDIIVEPGRIWSEASDKGWSRAAFPFSLIDKQSNLLRNGLATFVYTSREMSAIRFQITKESSHVGQLDLWGLANATYTPHDSAELETWISAYETEVSDRSDIRPWGELEAQHDTELLDQFDGKRIRREISQSGLMIGNKVYASDCNTRYGPYPYCRHMRHAVFSITKSLGGWFTALRMAEKYGAEIMDYKVSDYVDLKTSNNHWNDVTFEHLLSMVSGVGDVEPERVSHYVETYGSENSNALYRAGTWQEKLKVIERVGFYPWEAGEVFRYAAYDPVILAIALSELLRSKEGADADLWEMMEKEVFKPIGIASVPIRLSLQDAEGRQIPSFGGGMFVTLEDVTKMVSLIRANGKFGNTQILNANLLKETFVSTVLQNAYPTGWITNTGDETHYFRSLWIAPYPAAKGCTVPISQMSGAGGNAVVLMPNGITALRFASGPDEDDDNDTWDQTPMIRAADSIRSLCIVEE
jgi:CubicO group peptidase (beta-lactamase class C family)